MSRLVLVTGGAGFIGSHLVDALLARGDRVRVLDDFSTGRRENLAHCLADIELFEGDIRDKGLVTRAVAGCDGVLHEAAVASVTQSLADPVRCGSITHGGTVNVVRLARRAGAGGFVLASSCAVYGDADALPIGEDTPPRPLSPYALAKLLSEAVCRPVAFAAEQGPSAGAHTASGARGGSAGGGPVGGGPAGSGPAQGGSVQGGSAQGGSVQGEAAQGEAAQGGSAGDGPAEGRLPSLGCGRTRRSMRTVCLRYFNVYGPRQDPSSEYSGVIARFMDAAVAREAPRYVVYGDGRQSRDFVYVADVVAANLLALDACLVSAEGTGEGSAGDQGGGAGVAAAAVGDAAVGGAGAADIDGAVLNGAVLNIGSGGSVDVLTLAKEIERLRLGRGAREASGAGPAEPAIEFRAPREGDIRASRADIARARRLLGYEPVTSFADGLAATYAWYAGHSGAGVS